METVYDKNYVTISYDAEGKLGMVTWKSNCSKEEYREAFEAMLAYAKEHLIKYVLTDTRNQGVVSPENRKWFEKDMLPRGIEVGLKKVAAVTDANVFKRYYLNMLLSSSNKFNVPFKIFSNVEDAKTYLLADEGVLS